MKRWIIACAWICTCLCEPSFSQPALGYADSLAAQQNWAAARLAAERVVYRTQDPVLQSQALLRKARWYKEEERYADAQRTVERANAFVGSDSLRYLLKYEAALTAYLNEDYPAARTHAQQVRYLLAQTPYRWRVFHLELMALHGEQRWAEAKKLYEQHHREAGFLRPTEEVYGELPQLKSLNTAEWLHIFLPGVGQMYAGYFWEGVVSGVVNSAALAFALYHIWQGYYLTGIFTGAALFYAFYTGGYRYTGTLIGWRNEKITNDYNRQVNGRLLDPLPPAAGRQ